MPQAIDSATGTLGPLGIAGLMPVTTQAVLARYGYGGAVYFAEETKNPRLRVAKAVLWSAIITVTGELIPLIAMLMGSDSLTDLIGSDLPVQSSSCNARVTQ